MWDDKQNDKQNAKENIISMTLHFWDSLFGCEMINKMQRKKIRKVKKTKTTTNKSWNINLKKENKRRKKNFFFKGFLGIIFQWPYIF